MGRTGCGQPVPELRLAIKRQTAFDRAIAGRCHPDLRQGFHRVQLRARLHEPGHHQVGEHRVVIGRGIKPEGTVGAGDRIDQVAGPLPGDRQRGLLRPVPRRGHIDAQVKGLLLAPDDLLRLRPSQRQVLISVGRTDVDEFLAAAVLGVHDLHGPRSRNGLDRADKRAHSTRIYRPPPHHPLSTEKPGSEHPSPRANASIRSTSHQNGRSRVTESLTRAGANPRGEEGTRRFWAFAAAYRCATSSQLNTFHTALT